MKVFWGIFDGRNEWLVAAPTKKRARELLGITRYEMDRYASEGSNDEDEAFLIARPEVVHIRRSMSEGPMTERG